MELHAITGPKQPAMALKVVGNEALWHDFVGFFAKRCLGEEETETAGRIDAGGPGIVDENLSLLAGGHGANVVVPLEERYGRTDATA